MTAKRKINANYIEKTAFLCYTVENAIHNTPKYRKDLIK